MSHYENAICPNCYQKLGRYRVDITNVTKSHGYCPKCHESYTVIYGKEDLKTEKGYVK